MKLGFLSFCFKRQVLFLLLFVYVITVKAQICSEIRASGLVYCNDASVVQLQADIVDGACSNVEWYSSAAIDVPLSTGCDFTTPAVTGNIKYYVRDNTNQSQVINTQVGFDFNDTELTVQTGATFDGNARTNFLPTQDFVLNTVEARVSDWRGLTPDSLLIEIRNYSDPSKSVLFNVAVPASATYTNNETMILDIDYNFIAYDSYDIAFGQNNVQVYAHAGTPGTDIDYDAVFDPVIGVTESGPADSRTAGTDGYGPFYNWDISAELGAGCPKKEVNIIQRCIEICDDGIDNDSDGETDEACSAFSCDGKLLQSIGNFTSAGGSKLYEMSVSPVEFTEINNFPFGINSLAYSAAENRVYALILDGGSPDDGKVVRIASNGEYQVLDKLITKDGITIDFGFAADIGSDGNYYFLEEKTDGGGNVIGGTIYVFELVTLTEVSRVEVTFDSRIADVTFNPSTGNLFGITSTSPKRLYEFDPINGNTTIYPPMRLLDDDGDVIGGASNGVVGGIYFLPSGKMIAYGGFLGSNTQNDMIQIDLDEHVTNGNALVIDQNNLSASSNDGASCPYTLYVTKVADVEEALPGEEIEYTIEFNNNTGFVAPNVTFRDSISDYLTISSMGINDLGNSNIEQGTGINTKDLVIKDVDIPVGRSTLIFKVVVDSTAICNEDIIYNQAEVTNLSPALGFSTLSDNPNTPEEYDPTPVDLVPNFTPETPDIVSNGPICENEKLVLEDQANAGFLVWNGPNGFISNETKDSILSAGLIHAGEYLAFSNREGCESDTVRITVEVNPLPVAFISGVDSICLGASTPLNATSTIPSSSYLWILNTSNLSSTVINDPIATPSLNEDYTVEVSSPAGCKDTASVTVEVNEQPSVMVSPDISICPENMTPLQASGADSYLWSPAIGLNTDNQADVTASPNVTTTYKVIGQNTFGCEDSAEVVVTIFPNPAMTITDDLDICSGDQATLTTSGADSYIWSPSTGLNSTTLPSVLTQAIVTTTYQVIGENNSGCKDTVDVTVTVNETPLVDVTDDLSICEGDSAELVATGASDYVWTPDLGLNLDNVSTVTTSSTSTITYKVVGSNSSSCKDSAEVVITVNTQPLLTISDNDTICSGESTILDVLGAETFLWSPATGLNSTTSSTVTSSTLNTTLYQVIGTNTGGCQDTAEVMVTVDVTPVVDVTDDLSICEGETADLTATGASNYIWTPNLDLTTNNQATVTTSSTTTITYKVVGDNSSSCKDSAEVIVTVNTQPELNISDNDTICKGENKDLQVTGADQFLWSPSIGLSSITDGTVNTSVQNTTTYKVLGTNVGGCMDSAEVIITVAEVPVVEVSDDETICKGENATFIASGADNYVWSPATGLDIDNVATVVSSAITTISYQVIGSNSMGCSDTNNVTLNVLDNPIPSVEIDYLKDICEGDSLNFFITKSEFLGDSPAYRWVSVEAGGDNDIGTNNSLVLYNQTESKTVFLEVISSERCVTPANRLANSNTVNPAVNPFPDLIVSDVGNICEEALVNLSVTDANNVATSFQWMSLDDNSVYESTTNMLDLGLVNSRKSIQVSASEKGCSDQETVTINITNVFVDIAANKEKILLGDNVQLSVVTTGSSLTGNSDKDDGFSWLLGQDPSTRNPQETSIYYVQAERDGCVATDSVEVIVLAPLNAPYFFSPNDDAENDTWIVKELESYEDTRVTIFNRWGSKIITLENKENIWDGRYRTGEPVPEGVYYYVIEGEVGGNDISLTGYVTLVK